MIQLKRSNNPAISKPVGFIPASVQSRLPQGLSIPLQCINNKWLIKGGTAKIEQNMWWTIMTPVGIAMGQPDFGSMIPYMIMERYTPLLQAQMIQTVTSSLNAWAAATNQAGVNSVAIISVTIDASQIYKNTV